MAPLEPCKKGRCVLRTIVVSLCCFPVFVGLCVLLVLFCLFVLFCLVVWLFVCLLIWFWGRASQEEYNHDPTKYQAQ